MYVLKCRGNGKNNGLMVAKSGRKNSYTNSYTHAQKFKTRKQAEQNACDNEYPVDTGSNIYFPERIR